MLVVFGTNVLVSALWSRDGAPARVVGLAMGGHLQPCYDHRILAEHHQVLRRPKFGFAEWQVAGFLTWLENAGWSIVPDPVDILFADEADRKFYEVAKWCQAKLVTGNVRHFPQDGLALSVADFLKRYF